MMHTRRSFLSATIAAGAGLALAPKLFSQPGRSTTLFEWKAIREGAEVGVNWGGNSLVIRSGGAAAIVDSKHCGLGATLRREATALGAPIGTLINTHHHRDHTGGNSMFHADAAIIAQTRAKERIVNQAEAMVSSVDDTLKDLRAGSVLPPEQALAEVNEFVMGLGMVQPEHFAPTLLVETEHTLKVGEVEVHLRHTGAGHTDNDLFVHIPAWNVLHTGDLLFHKLHPFVDAASGATTMGWEKSLQAMIDLCDEDTIVVPGHGDVCRVQGLREQMEYFAKMREKVRFAKDVEGMTRDEVVKLQPGGFADYGFAQMLPRVLGTIFDELSAGG